MLSDKEMLPKLNTSQSRRLEGIKLPGEFLPVDVDRVPQMFGLHMTPFSLEGLGADRRQRGMPGSHSSIH